MVGIISDELFTAKGGVHINDVPKINHHFGQYHNIES
jgi:hypothetical protein